MITKNQEEIKKQIIHRYENLLLDQVDFDPENPDDNTLHLTISETDEQNRNIFLKNSSSQLKEVVSPVFMEILALSCIIAANRDTTGKMVIFAGISNFKKLAPMPANTHITGNVTKLSDKKGFLKFKGELYNGPQTIGEGQMMAYFTELDTEAEVQKHCDLPEQNCNIPVNKNTELKPSTMINADAITFLDDTRCTTTYTYPTDHPFIKGHFPENALMMGVMQWMCIEDNLTAYIQEKNLSGNHTISGNAQIYKNDGVLVAEVKGFILKTTHNIEGQNSQAEIIETKKIVFRSMVKPGETLIINCTDLERS